MKNYEERVSQNPESSIIAALLAVKCHPIDDFTLGFSTFRKKKMEKTPVACKLVYYLERKCAMIFSGKNTHKCV